MASPIAVITVNFNAGEELTECVRSVLASTVPAEVVVVDNASTDGSVRALEDALGKEPRLRTIEMGVNAGFARANNRALAEVSSEYVLLLNPDCVLRPGALARLKAVLDERPAAGMAGGLLLNPDGTEQAGCRRLMPTPRRAFMRAFGLSRLGAGRHPSLGDFVLRGQPLPPGPVEVEAISGAFMLVRTSALREVGLLDEGYFLHCEDLDWCMRFRKAGRAVVFVPDAVAVHDKGRCGRDRPVRVLWHMHRGMVRFYRKFFRQEYPAPLLWLVIAGVALRFTALTSYALLRRVRTAF